MLALKEQGEIVSEIYCFSECDATIFFKTTMCGCCEKYVSKMIGFMISIYSFHRLEMFLWNYAQSKSGATKTIYKCGFEYVF